VCFRIYTDFCVFFEEGGFANWQVYLNSNNSIFSNLNSFLWIEASTIVSSYTENSVFKEIEQIIYDRSYLLYFSNLETITHTFLNCYAINLAGISILIQRPVISESKLSFHKSRIFGSQRAFSGVHYVTISLDDVVIEGFYGNGEGEAITTFYDSRIIISNRTVFNLENTYLVYATDGAPYFFDFRI
jgi:hypothetical protein